MNELLFAYGTLKEADVQKYVFGRILDGMADTLQGFVISERRMYGRYLVLEKGSDTSAAIQGMCFALSKSELLKADIYEGPAYKRVALSLKSGAVAWVYIEKDGS